MTRYLVNTDAVTPHGLNFRSAPSARADTLVGVLRGGDIVESTGAPHSAPPITWLPARVVWSAAVPPGTAGYVAMRSGDDTYLIPADDAPEADGAVRALSQRDPRWKSASLGFDDALTIGSDGCTLTCLAMAANRYGFDETPAALNERLKALGAGRGFVGPLIVWAGLAAALPGMQLKSFVLCRTQPAPIAQIDAFIAAGKPVVVELDQAPAAGLQHHWVVLAQRRGDDYLMHDPWPWPVESGGASLMARYGFAGSPERVITAAVFYDGPHAPPPPVPVPSFAATVAAHPDVVEAGGLALRDAPVNGAVLARLPPGAGLSVLEGEAARIKVGVKGQWLHARDGEGRAGYAAAWYLEVTPPAAPREVLRSLSSQEVQPPLRGAPRGARAGLVVVVEGRTRIPRRGAVLRAAPPRGRELARLTAGTRLEVVEAARGAEAKIGRRGEWLKVRDADGRVGYIAGHCVRR